MMVRTPAVRKPRLMGAIADLSLSVARTANTPTIDASTPIARATSGKLRPRAGGDGGRRGLGEHDYDRRPDEAEADGEHAGDAAGSEGHLEGARQRAALRGGRRPHVSAHGQAHADEAGEPRHERPGEEGDR